MMLKRLTFCLLIASALLVMVYVIFTLSRLQPGKHQSRHHLYPHHISDQSITPVSDTKHFMVGAYKEHRVKGCSVRIISIFRQDSVQPLYCVFYCGTHWANGTMAEVQIHPEEFALGFAFVATDVLCPCPPGCNGSHVTIATQADAKLAQKHTFLRIQNLVKREEEERIQFNFTVCWSNLFDDHNNVLQVTQTLEMYKLLGVQQVVVYNTSCGPDLERLLQSYTQEGFVEVVPWPIDQHMNPSRGWLFNEHGGEIHYYGQLATLNDCVYRHMYQSRYVLLNDIDEIITPYQHQTLPQMMDALQRQHPKARVFRIENHIFPKSQYDLSGRFERPLWRDVPGSNILEHIYRQEPIDTKQQMKMIVQPRALEKTSVHSVLRNYGETVLVPPQLCRMLHIKFPIPGVSKEELHEDKRFWDYEIQLVPNVDKALERAGLLI